MAVPLGAAVALVALLSGVAGEWGLYGPGGPGAGWVAAATLAPAAATCGSGPDLPAGWGQDPHAGMVRVPAGQIVLGQQGAYADERPAGAPQDVTTFWMDRTEVTNAQFAAFVQATGYRTQAEREGAAAVFQARPPGQGGHSSAGAPAAPGTAGEQVPNWWHWRAGASWRQPEGPGSDLRGRAQHPVVHVTLADALAYARWLGRDLPTEAEWEHAARAGGQPETLTREPRDPQGRPLANYWQGVFPDLNTQEDGYAALAPAGCFAANGYGLYDLIGNVWELTRDAYQGPHQPHGQGDLSALRRPPVPGRTVVIKGGSFLCAASYCQRYRAAARHPHEPDMPTSHVGFRTVLRG
ncbi:formylglycine-generating enzyme family protein [Ideonella livida]|uniref:Formylglycine-generating enzyme family protein n=1 Tax=Ideonella livida TaxID=2707176 RepID=A0A7C9PH55_9BURK|nr:formylglycine-generating enzyme family protein [Ideonella livida]NDY91796.1 formylglycine-generating enzyme family protein [Ideonella livida]